MYTPRSLNIVTVWVQHSYTKGLYCLLPSCGSKRLDSCYGSTTYREGKGSYRYKARLNATAVSRLGFVVPSPPSHYRISLSQEWARQECHLSVRFSGNLTIAPSGTGHTKIMVESTAVAQNRSTLGHYPGYVLELVEITLCPFSARNLPWRSALEPPFLCDEIKKESQL